MNATLTGNGETETAASETPRRRLEGLPSRQRLTGDQAAARTVMVRRLRIALPVLVIVLVGALLLNTRSKGVDEAFLDDFADLEATPEELKMANPRFAGVDDKGFPYEITADTALQAPGVQEVVDLVNPVAVTKGVDESTKVVANKGRYQSQTNMLELTDSVTMEHVIGGDAYVLKTPAATVSIGDETVHSTAGVEGAGETGTLRADRMRAYNGEGRVVFEGNVSMRIFPSKGGLKKGAGGDAAPTEEGKP